MKNLKIWTDDHLPCIQFEHDGKTVSLLWTDPLLAGRCQACEDGDLAFEAVFRHHPTIIQILKDPTNVNLEGTNADRDQDDEDDEDWYVFNCSAGRLEVSV